MYNFLIENNLLNKYQSGFLSHHSTVFHLLDIFHNICQAFDINMFSCIVLCDVSKAFHRVWHKGLTFNPLKTEAVLFTLKKQEFFPQLVFDNTPISFVDSHKHLGFTLSSTGQWHSHIENIVKSASKIWGIMRKLKFSLSRNALNQLYISYMLHILDYASVVWNGCSEQDSVTLQKFKMKQPYL